MGADDVVKGLKRNDAELSVAALLKVPPQERGELLAAVGGLFRAAVADAHHRGDFGRCGYWASRAAKEERLCGEAGSADAARCWWTLLWGAVRTKDLSRAALAWRHLEAEAQTRAPALAKELGAFIDSGGTVAPSAPLIDPRLGHEPTAQRRPRPSAPTSAAEIETKVLALCAQHPWPVFGETMEAWCQKAPSELALPLRVLGVKLAVRELLLRAQKRQGDVSPALLVASLLKDAGTPAEVADDVLVAFRVVSSGAGPEPLATEAAGRTFSALAATAARFPSHRELVSRAVESRLFAEGAARSGLRLIETLLEVSPGDAATAPSAALAVKALNLWFILNDDAPAPAPAPEWLVRAFERLARERTALTRLLGDIDVKKRGDVLDAISGLLPIEVGEAIVDGVWDGSTQPVRRDLGALLEDLIDRTQFEDFTSSRLRRLSRAGAGPGPDLEAFLIEAQREYEGADLSKPARRLFERHEAQLLTLDMDFLGMALEGAPTHDAARQKVDRYVSGKGVVAQIEAAAVATGTGFFQLAVELEGRVLLDFADDVKTLAEAFHAVRRLGAPKNTERCFGQALLRAYEANPVPGDSINRAVEAARLAEARGPKKKKTATKKPKAKAKTPKKQTPKKGQSREKPSPKKTKQTGLLF